MKTVQRSNRFDRMEGREAGVSLRDNGMAEMAALEGVSVWWEDDSVKAGRLVKGATIEQWTKAAGMDFLIKKAAVRYYADRAQTKLMTMQDQVALIRSDTGEALGIVSPDYNIVQPFEVMEFFREPVENMGFELTTAGTLFGGKRFWALAKITEGVISGWDKIGAYLLLTTGADGATATEGRQISICVVCANTLRLALLEENNKRARQSHRSRYDEKRLKADLGLAADLFPKFIETANELSRVKVSDAVADEFVMKLLSGGAAQAEVQQVVAEQSQGDSLADLLKGPYILPEIEIEGKARRPRGMDAILQLFEGEGMGATQKGRASTAWGLVNAVTEFTDHHSTAKTADHRVAKAWFGSGEALKAEAMQQAIAQFL